MEQRFSIPRSPLASAFAEQERMAELLQAVQQIAHIGFWEMRQPQDEVRWSDGLFGILGVERNGFDGRSESYMRVIHPEDRQRIEDLLDRTRRGEMVPPFEHRVVHHDGEVRHVRCISRMIPNDDGNLFYGIVQDITDQKHAEENLQRLAARLSTTLESITDGFFTIGTDWTLTYVNGEAVRMLRIPHGQLLGRTLWELFPEAQGMGFEQRLRRAATERLAMSFDEYAAALGVWFEVRVYPSDEGLAVYFTDITERRRAEEELRASEERFKYVTRATSDAVWDWDVTNDHVWRSEQMYRMFGIAVSDVEDPVGSWEHRVHPDDRERVMQELGAALASSLTTWTYEYRLLRGDNTTYADVLTHCHMIRDEAGKTTRMVGAIVDISERKRAEQLQKIAEDQVRKQASLLEKTTDAIIVCDLDDCVTFWNHGAENLYGWRAGEVIGRKISDLIHPDPRDASALHDAIRAHGEWRGESRERHKDGEIITVESHWTLVRDADGNPDSIFAIKTDVTQRKDSEQKIRRLAFYDALTGLPNRVLLTERLRQLLVSDSQATRHSAILLLDLDDFKTLNDTYGHETGDKLLQQVAQRLVSCVGSVDTVARLGGDEFVVLVVPVADENRTEAIDRVRRLADKILLALRQPFVLGNHHNYFVTPSIGITLFSHAQETIEDILKRADLAMYQAKASGRNTMRFFDPEMEAVVAARVALESDMREALLAQQFALHFQPQLSAEGVLIGTEALLRWPHPVRGMVPPLSFIPLAESTGLILPLGQWVLHTACTVLKRWSGIPGLERLSIAVNVSAVQLRSAGFVEQVLSILEQSGADPTLLKIELTESVLVDNIEDSIAKMMVLKSKGVGFSLDDFGTGYSSLSYLKRLPLDQLKIDRSFVRDIQTDPNDAAIARTIITLGQSIGLSVIAEGVENEGQRDFLCEHGCPAFQGFLFSRPLPLEEFEQFSLRVGGRDCTH
jgi:diguanylate cyclase (GGDEF)-like protein/PAS domain S-box-containing protein